MTVTEKKQQIEELLARCGKEQQQALREREGLIGLLTEKQNQVMQQGFAIQHLQGQLEIVNGILAGEKAGAEKPGETAKIAAVPAPVSKKKPRTGSASA